MQQFIEWFNSFLTQPSPLRAVMFGLLLSWGGTQYLKKRGLELMRRWLDELDDESHRTVIRAIAFMLAWTPVYLMWPAIEITERALAAGVTAVCAPYAYSFFTAIAFHFFPWLEPKLSARPKDGAA